MNALFDWIFRLGDKVGSAGALISAMGCAMCFPAIAGLGAPIGLGFLSQWEWFFINTLLPAFAWLVIAVHALAWFAHRQWHRTLVGMVGPVLLLLSLYPWFQYAWSTYVTYSALALMGAVSLWDLVWPANRRCEPEHSADY